MLPHARLLPLRKRHRYTQSDVARVLRIAQRTYSDYERGIVMPDVEQIVTLARFYDVSVDYLIGASNELRGFPVC